MQQDRTDYGKRMRFADLKLLLGQLKGESFQVALDVGHTSGLGDHTGAVLDGPPDQDLHTVTFY